MFKELFSSSDMVNEQLACEVFRAVPEEGISIAISDKNGDLWANRDDRILDWSKSNDDIDTLFSRLDDGVEIAMLPCESYCLFATDITVNMTNSGYALLAVANNGQPDSLAQLPLIELCLNQMSLLAATIQKNNIIHLESIKKNPAYKAL